MAQMVNSSKMSNSGTAVSYFSSRIKTQTHWQIVKKQWQALKGLESAFYFLDLQQGCKLIALFEALMSLGRICWVYYLVYRPDTKALHPAPKWVYLWPKGEKNYICYHYTNYHFHVSLHLVTIFNSMLLFMGIKGVNVVLLYCWMYISLLTGTMTNINNIFNNFRLSQGFFTIPTLVLQYYCFLIVISLIWKIRGMPKSSAMEMDEHPLEIED